MPRANRHFLPGHVWHITHRCHRKEFLLKFQRDRKCWRRWLFEARKRFGLCVLNYIATSNHVHILVMDKGEGEIARSMQLIAGRTAQEYNRRKGRLGAYWQDRYHATAVDTEAYLARCMVYIDLNMVRAGAVAHPREWDVCGYREIQEAPARYRIIDRHVLKGLLGIGDEERLRREHEAWVEDALKNEGRKRQGAWSEVLAVGREEFVVGVQGQLATSGQHKEVKEQDGVHVLREGSAAYRYEIDPEMEPLSASEAPLSAEVSL